MEHLTDSGSAKVVDLILPLEPEMVRVIRLTVSGIASRLGFQLDEIEDIKVAVAEICNRIIVKASHNTQRCQIKFIIESSELKIEFSFESSKPEDFRLFEENDEFGLAIVSALMDHVEINSSCESSTIITLSMVK